MDNDICKVRALRHLEGALLLLERVKATMSRLSQSERAGPIAQEEEAAYRSVNSVVLSARPASYTEKFCVNPCEFHPCIRPPSVNAPPLCYLVEQLLQENRHRKRRIDEGSSSNGKLIC